MFEFKLPELAENVESATVSKLLVAKGDKITKEQNVIELETEKAAMEVPCPKGGAITEILVKEGDTVKVGQVILKVDTAGEAEEAKPAETKKPPAQVQEDKTQEDKTPEDKTQDTKAQEHTTKESPQKPEKNETKNETAQATAESETKSSRRVVVIGAGPGGYAAAFLAADLGLDITLVDTDVNPGGVCLYRGCIPSKALLHAAKVLSESREAKAFGIEFGKPKIDIDKLRGWKNKVVTQLTGGLGQLSKQRKVKYIQGYATFENSNTLKIKKADKTEETLSFDTAVIATGSSPIKFPGVPDFPRVLDSTSALEIENVPKSLLLVGAGYIGLELGTVYAELGSEVSVVEMMPGIIPGADRDLSSILEKRLKTIFKRILVSTKVIKVEEEKDALNVTFEDKDGKQSTGQYENILVAIGRRPNSKNLGLEKTKVAVDDKGFIRINAQRQTDDPAIYAIGDVAGNPMLAHKASHEGRVAVEAIAGHKVAFEPLAIPAVVFTDPEIAWCGLTETEAKQQDRQVEVVKFPWGASGRALTLNRSDGLTKLIIDPVTERILGVAIVGPGAGELISEGVLAIEMGAVVADLKLSIHPHPTLTETLMESAETFFGQSTHIYRPKKK
jgi:dihydrolipoamide dehydrogenase